MQIYISLICIKKDYSTLTLHVYCVSCVCSCHITFYISVFVIKYILFAYV